MNATATAALIQVEALMTKALAAFQAGDLEASRAFEAEAAKFEKVADEASR